MGLDPNRFRDFYRWLSRVTCARFLSLKRAG